MVRSIDNYDDVIDSRDVIARIEELEAEQETLMDALEEARTRVEDYQETHDAVPTDVVVAVDEAEDELKEWIDEYSDELKVLKDLADQGESSPDWNYGEALIHDSYFTEYVRELVIDIGDLPPNLPSYIANNVDWDGVAKDIQYDYFAVDFDGQTYWIRG